MKRTAPHLLGVLMLAVIVTPAQAHKRPRHLPSLCAPSSTPYKSHTTPYRRTLAADPLAQVYSLWETPAPTVVVGLQAQRQPIYGCAYGRRGAILLGSEPWNNGGRYMSLNVSGDRNVVLAGVLVAYEDYSETEGLEGFRFGVTIQDLRSGRILRHEPTGKRKVSGEPELEFGFGHTTAIVLNEHGAVAWIVEVPPDEGGGFQVHAADSAGSTVLASGHDIDPSSLALGGSTLYWTQGGQAHSAILH